MLRLERDGGGWRQARERVELRTNQECAAVLRESALLLPPGDGDGDGDGGGGGGDGGEPIAELAFGDSGSVGVRALSARFALERLQPEAGGEAPPPDGERQPQQQQQHAQPQQPQPQQPLLQRPAKRSRSVSGDKFLRFGAQHRLVIRRRVGAQPGASPYARYALVPSQELLDKLAAGGAPAPAAPSVSAAAAATPASAAAPSAPPPPPPAPPSPAEFAPPPPGHFYHGLCLAQWDFEKQSGVIEFFVRHGGELSGAGAGAGAGARGVGGKRPPGWLLEPGRTTHVLVPDEMDVEKALSRLRQQRQYLKEQRRQQQQQQQRQNGAAAAAAAAAASAPPHDARSSEEEEEEEGDEAARLLALIPDGAVFVPQAFFVACNRARALLPSRPFASDVRLMLQGLADRRAAKRQRRQQQLQQGPSPRKASDPGAPDAPKPPPAAAVLAPGEAWGAGGRWVAPWDEAGARRTLRVLRRWYRFASGRGHRGGDAAAAGGLAAAEADLVARADEDTGDEGGSGGEEEEEDGGGGGGAGSGNESGGVSGSGGGGGEGGGPRGPPAPDLGGGDRDKQALPPPSKEEEEEERDEYNAYVVRVAAAAAAAGGAASGDAGGGAQEEEEGGGRPCRHAACARRPTLCLVNELLLVGEMDNPKDRGAQDNTYHRKRALDNGARVLRGLQRPLDGAAGARRALARAGVRGGTLEKVLTILARGRHPRVAERARDPANVARARLCRAWGVSSKKADELFGKGLSDPAAVLRAAEAGAVQLTAQMRCGLEHYDDFARRIPRAEVAEAQRLVAGAALDAIAELLAERDGGDVPEQRGELRDALRMELASTPGCVHARVLGSFVRGQTDDCGDVDVLIAGPAERTPASRLPLAGLTPRLLLARLLRILRERRWLLPDMLEQWVAKYGAGALTAAELGEQGEDARPLSSSFSGVWRGPSSPCARRFDAKWYARPVLPLATIYFGSGTSFNRQLRLYAATPPASLRAKALALSAAHGNVAGVGNCFHLSDRELAVAHRPENEPLHHKDDGLPAHANRQAKEVNENVVGPRLAVADERAVFEALGLEYVPPHLRELAG